MDYFFKPNKTLAVAFIAILMTPISILIDRANDPVAPPYFRELLYPDSTANGEPVSELNAVQVDTTQSDTLPPVAENPTGEAAIYDSVNDASAKRQANIVADNWRKATELAEQTQAAPALPDVDGFSLAQMKATGSGLQTATPIDRDFVQLSTYEFRQKYGDAIGQHYSSAYALGSTQREQALTSQRTDSELIGDTAITVLSTPVSLLGGIASLGLGGAGYVSQKLGATTVGNALTTAGTKTSELVGDFTKGAQSFQSNKLNDARQVFSAETGLQARDNAAQAEIDAKTYGNVTATGLQIAKDIIGSIGAHFPQ